jgi:hypothetical protein
VPFNVLAPLIEGRALQPGGLASLNPYEGSLGNCHCCCVRHVDAFAHLLSGPVREGRRVFPELELFGSARSVLISIVD